MWGSREKGLSQRWHPDYKPKWQAGWWCCAQQSGKEVAERGDYELCFSHIELELMARHPWKDVRMTAWDFSSERRRPVWSRDIDLRLISIEMAAEFVFEDVITQRQSVDGEEKGTKDRALWNPPQKLEQRWGSSSEGNTGGEIREERGQPGEEKLLNIL